MTTTKLCDGCNKQKQEEEIKKTLLHFCKEYEDLCLDCRMDNKRGEKFSTLELESEKFVDILVELDSEYHRAQSKVENVKSEIEKVRREQRSLWSKIQNFDWSQEISVD